MGESRADLRARSQRGDRLRGPAVPVPRRLRLRLHPRCRARQRTRQAPARREYHLAAGGEEPLPVARAQVRAQGPGGLFSRGDRGLVCPCHSFVRKALEAYFTVLIEALWPKERILEMYLNVAQFGNGIYGVQAAAQRFWHKPARRLSSSEAALLAAVLPNPLRLRVDRPSRYVLARRDWILGQMRGLGGPGYLRALESERRTAR